MLLKSRSTYHFNLLKMFFDVDKSISAMDQLIIQFTPNTLRIYIYTCISLTDQTLK